MNQSNKDAISKLQEDISDDSDESGQINDQMQAADIMSQKSFKSHKSIKSHAIQRKSSNAVADRLNVKENTLAAGDLEMGSYPRQYSRGSKRSAQNNRNAAP